VITPNASTIKSKIWTIATFIVLILAIGLFFYLDRHDNLSTALRSWGFIGIVASILIMAIICVTPMPSEGLLILYMKIYGAWWGAFYSWIGATFSSIIVFMLARNVGTPIVRSIFKPHRFELVDRWVRERGTSGLLFARFLPLPGFIVSYIVGTIPSVRLWSYLWTGAVSIVPYYVSTALIFLGISHGWSTWLGLGTIFILIFWGVSYMVKKRAL
jgi:uncharacterized membrane protein YdjX (TVP38/TMEM64 family)